MRAHHVLLLSLCLLAAAYAVLLFVSPAAAPIGVTLTVVGLVLVSTRYAWRAKFLAMGTFVSGVPCSRQRPTDLGCISTI